MPQGRIRRINWEIFDMPVSYKTRAQNRMADARNVFTKQGVLETRNGTSLYNSTDVSVEQIDSIAYFKNNSGTAYTIAKSDSQIWSVPTSGASTSLKSGLSAGSKMRWTPFNGRLLMAVEGDGTFAYDGTDFYTLGESVPGAPSVAASGSGNSLTAGDYQVAVTWFASTLGWETNIGTASGTVTISSGQRVDVTSIPTSVTHPKIDKKRVYVKDISNNSDWVFWDEIPLATTTETIDSDPTSSIVAPKTNGSPPANAKYCVMFGKEWVVSGVSSDPSAVFRSEDYLPDAFSDYASPTDPSTLKTLQVGGSGPVTGLGVGFYHNDQAAPFLCMFKENSFEIYTEQGGQRTQILVSNEIGCVAHDTIKTINGMVYFLSNRGWFVCINGLLYKKPDGRAIDLADGDLNDIFQRSGFTFELNKQNYSNFFSVYYQTLNHYMTFVSEGSNDSVNKAYNYELDIQGFRPYEFPANFHCGCIAKDSQGEDIVLLGGNAGRIYKHSVKESYSDTLDDDSTQAIYAMALLYWISGQDMMATYNFGHLSLEAFAQDTAISAYYFLNYNLTDPLIKSFDMSKADSGFQLDVSRLDVDILTSGDDLQVARYGGGIYKTAKNILIQIFQNTEGSNLRIMRGQLDVSKNGNPAI